MKMIVVGLPNCKKLNEKNHWELKEHLAVLHILQMNGKE
jgi:hypothetical protein